MWCMNRVRGITASIYIVDLRGPNGATGSKVQLKLVIFRNCENRVESQQKKQFDFSIDFFSFLDLGFP